MVKNILNLKKFYIQQLATTSLDYLATGIDLFQQQKKNPEHSGYQAAIGNLTIAVELMLKAFIASKHLTLLFKELPLEARAYLTCPNDLPSDFHWQVLEVDLKSAAYKMIELDECIALFYIFFPDTKTELQPHLRFLSRVRNSSVHSYLPSFHRYELDRMVYLALKIHEILEATKILVHLPKRVSGKDKQILNEFQKTKLDRLDKKVKSAQKRAKERKSPPSSIISTSLNHWEYEKVICPICNSEARLLGETEMVQGEPDQDENYPEASLIFFGDSFECNECGLILDDDEEISKVGMKTVFDRSEETREYAGVLRRRRRILAAIS